MQYVATGIQDIIVQLPPNSDWHQEDEFLAQELQRTESIHMLAEQQITPSIYNPREYLANKWTSRLNPIHANTSLHKVGCTFGRYSMPGGWATKYLQRITTSFFCSIDWEGIKWATLADEFTIIDGCKQLQPSRASSSTQ
jgi:hypothetical protein